MGEILRVIRNSPTDLTPVLESVARNAARCARPYHVSERGLPWVDAVDIAPGGAHHHDHDGVESQPSLARASRSAGVHRGQRPSLRRALSNLLLSLGVGVETFESGGAFTSSDARMVTEKRG
jgi:hypothetical protein